MDKNSCAGRKRKAIQLTQAPSVALTQFPNDVENFQEPVQLGTTTQTKSTPATQVDQDTSTACVEDGNNFFNQNAEAVSTPPVRNQPLRTIPSKHSYSPAFFMRHKRDSPLETPCFSTSVNSLDNIRRAPVTILNIDRLVTYLITTQPTASNALARKKTIRVLHNLKDSLDAIFK